MRILTPLSKKRVRQYFTCGIHTFSAPLSMLFFWPQLPALFDPNSFSCINLDFLHHTAWRNSCSSIPGHTLASEKLSALFPSDSSSLHAVSPEPPSPLKLPPVQYASFGSCNCYHDPEPRAGRVKLQDKKLQALHFSQQFIPLWLCPVPAWSSPSRRPGTSLFMPPSTLASFS